MTIAACYLSSEGVVFGADSTSTMFVKGWGPDATGAEHHYNYAQKVFQVGQDSTLGMTMWGLGNVGAISHRTLIAQFADSLLASAAQSVEEVANRWNQFFWSSYSTQLASILQRAQQLHQNQSRSADENNELIWLMERFSGGFCVGGYLAYDHMPAHFCPIIS